MQTNLKGQIFFPSGQDHDRYYDYIPMPTTTISNSFATVEDYVETWTGVIHESINLHLWTRSKLYHKLMKNADISKLSERRPDLKYFQSSRMNSEKENKLEIPNSIQPKLTAEEVADMDPPCCEHEITCKVSMVRKSGPNTGRFFYTCNHRRRKCKFFQWVDEIRRYTIQTDHYCPQEDDQIVKINNMRALMSYLNRNKLNLFLDCQIQRKSVGIDLDSEKKTEKIDEELLNGKRHTVLKLSRQEQSTTKGDIWVLSQSLEFNTDDSLLVRVLSNNQSASGELIVQPIRDTVPIEWQNGVEIHAMLLMKAHLEFSYLHNLHRLHNIPIFPDLLQSRSASRKGFANTKLHNKTPKPVATFDVTLDDAMKIVDRFTEKFKLTDEQTTIISTIVESLIDKKNSVSPVVMVDGVVGSGKTFLLALTVLLIFEMLSANQNTAEKECEAVIGQKRRAGNKWKVLVTAKLDSVVDNLLLKLSELGFPRIARYGDLVKIDKNLLPFSLHCKRGSEEHVKQLKMILRHTEQSDPGRHHIEKSLEIALSGGTKRLLHNAFVVGTTCCDSLAPSIGYCKFPIIIMDDITTLSEPLSLSPLTRFSCEKLLIAGDSRQLSMRTYAIEQPLFQRLLDSGSDVLHLTANIRCHPHVVQLLNNVVYEDKMEQMSNKDKRLIKKLPGICICDVMGREESCNESWKNDDEARFCAEVVKVLLSHGVPGTSVGVMATYDAQVSAITSSLQEIEFYDLSDVNCIKVGTVPSLAACEFDVVIISCVRTSNVNEQTLSDVIRMLTRARSHVIVAANVRHLASNPLWSRVVDFCKEKNKQVTSAFNFRKLFQGGLVISHEDPLIAEHCDVTEDSNLSSQKSSDEDAEEEFFKQLKRSSTAPPCDNSDDEIPVLRHKRPKVMEIEAKVENVETSSTPEEKGGCVTDMTSEEQTVTVTGKYCDDVTNDNVISNDKIIVSDANSVTLSNTAGRLFTIRDCDLTLDGENVIGESIDDVMSLPM